MSNQIKMPELQKSFGQCKVKRILVQKDDMVCEGQAVMEVECDNLILEISSEFDGVIEQLCVEESQKINSNQLAFEVRHPEPTEEQKITELREQLRNNQVFEQNFKKMFIGLGLLAIVGLLLYVT